MKTEINVFKKYTYLICDAINPLLSIIINGLIASHSFCYQLLFTLHLDFFASYPPPHKLHTLYFKVNFQTYHSLNQNIKRSVIYLTTFQTFLFMLGFDERQFCQFQGLKNQPVLIDPSGPRGPAWGLPISKTTLTWIKH